MAKQCDIWVVAEQRRSKLNPVTFELTGKARELAYKSEAKVSLLLLGYGIEPLSYELISRGADQVILIQDPELENYGLLPYTHVITELIKEYEPDILLIGATPIGMELAPRVAARIGTGLSAHCIDLEIDKNGGLIQTVPGWGGGLLAKIKCPDTRPQMATVMPGTIQAPEPMDRKGEIIRKHIPIPNTKDKLQSLEIKETQTSTIPLEKAEVVIAGGWGIGSKENWKLLDELASLLGGAVGATRPPVDEGWAEESQMIGQSGKTVRPTLYMGFGISGVMHHVVGMDQSKYIISVNNDPNAEIFDTSDLIIEEDLNRILPLLIKEIKEIKKISNEEDNYGHEGIG